VNVLPHRRHRVAWTTPDEPTVWLAIFYSAAGTMPVP
jgi:cupin 2 domain-containing protein